ncbi:MAG: methyltransferase domain-containing protein [Bacteroidetes bacterium]|nr:methyltransferase domain-containing protein [Bacteroidota bacterium]
MASNCKICKRNNSSIFIEFNKYPKTISYLFNNRESAIQDQAPILFLKCNYCQHIQISTDMPQDFYDDYIMTVSHSPKMHNFQLEQANQFVNKYNLIGKSILEAGCGDGNFSEILKSMGCNVIGNEPSHSFRQLALKRGLTVDDKFINETYTNPNAPFDAIVSREVMEHVPEPIDFLTNLRRILKPDGVALIEVPNFEKALRENRYYDMFPDHLSYFTKESLTAAMLISGFKNIEIEYGMDEEFIYAFATNNNISNNEMVLSVKHISEDFKKLNVEFKNIVIWGAGGKGISALGSQEDISKVKYVVDSDPFKQNKFLPSSGLLVKKPEDLFNDKSVDLLIITNLAYTDEIVKILQENKFSKKVMLLSRSGIVSVNLN